MISFVFCYELLMISQYYLKLIFISTTSQITITLQSKVYHKILTVYLVASAGMRKPGALFTALDGVKQRTF